MFRNSEGYADPTAGLALKRIMREERRARRSVPISVPMKTTRPTVNARSRGRTANCTRWVKAYPKGGKDTIEPVRKGEVKK